MSYRKLANGKIKIEVEKQVNGQRRRKAKTIETDCKGKDLKFQIAEIEKQLTEQLIGDNYDMSQYTFRQFSEYFLETCTCKQKTIDGYRNKLRNHTLDFFGKMQITEIKKYHIEAFISELRKTKSDRTGEPLSPKTIKHHRDLLRTIFNKAIDLEIIDKNPVDGVKIPTVHQSLQGKYYTKEEIEEIIGMLAKYGTHKYLCFFVLQFYTGARPSEMYGLQWKKIDFNNQTITIDKALIKTTKGYQLNSTKTEDLRIIQLTPQLLIYLNQLKTLEIAKHKTEDIENKYVFTNEKGEHLHDGAFRTYLRRFCKKHKLKYVSPYGIRHTTGTVLSEENIPLINIAKVLGHTNQTTTQKYIHPVQTVDEKAQSILAEISTPKIRIIK